MFCSLVVTVTFHLNLIGFSTGTPFQHYINLNRVEMAPVTGEEDGSNGLAHSGGMNGREDIRLGRLLHLYRVLN